MDPSFGARLRAQREQQQVALSAISEATKIKLSILEALERDDVSQWPEGIYRRAYVRGYARAVGLDPETLVREFLEAHPDPVVAPPAEDTELENPPWPSGFRRLVTSAMAVIPSRRQGEERAVVAEPLQPPVTVEPPVPVQAPPTDTPPSEVPNERAPRRELNLVDVAELCTRLGRVLDRREAAPILEDAVSAFDAIGVIVWSWDRRATVLHPLLACGYPETTVARMPRVRAEADNAIAAAFQSAATCIVNGGGELTGALVVPMMSHGGCVGVLAIELQHGDEQREDVQAFATILAAQLVTLVGSASLAEAVNA